MKIVSWNVNGIAACVRKGLAKFLDNVRPDILCCQEIKTKYPLKIPGYLQYWNPARRSGYSGTLTLTRREPLACQMGMGTEELDGEGRLIVLEYEDYYVLNVYVPSLNTYSSPDRVEFRGKWDRAFRDFVLKLPKPVIMAGDFNVVRAYIDSYPENGKNDPAAPLFLPQTKGDFEKLLSGGFVDAFRVLYPGREGAYTWWGPKNHDRALNRGSRLDYFLVSEGLMETVQRIDFLVEIMGSDHCPISMLLSPVPPKKELDDEELAVRWRSIDWKEMWYTLRQKQKELSLAAFHRDWRLVELLQKEIVHSWTARALAVCVAANSNTEVGVDGVRWTTDAQKARAALSLSPKGYHPLPYRHTEIKEKGKKRIIHVPAIRDRAMMILYAFSLDPVSEATADKRSFFARKGRSIHDLHAYLHRDLSGENAPEWVCIIDVKSFYDHIIQSWLIEHIPTNKTVLRKFLKAGVIIKGDLFSTEQGISLGTSLSPILGNMTLDGLQSYIYQRLYPQGHTDYLNGEMNRFADDIVVLTRTREHAERVMQITMEFLAERGLKLNFDKSHIVNVAEGFDFLSRHYEKRDGIVYVTPSDSAVSRIECELEEFITTFRGTQRDMIEKINRKLSGWAGYHRATDSYMVFRHIDSVVEGLLIDRMCTRYSHWHRETVLEKFWVKEGKYRVFALPDDRSCRVKRLGNLPTVEHKPCRLKVNPYLDEDYFEWLKKRRDVQKANGKYREVWDRQKGRCAYCGQAMLPDQEVEVIEAVIGQGFQPGNLLYIHRQCAFEIHSEPDVPGGHIDLSALLGTYTTGTTTEESPYQGLTEFFRLSQKSPVTLTFQEIEELTGGKLPWEAERYEAFWRDPEPGTSSPMWLMEHYGSRTKEASPRDYCICDSWLTQGYELWNLHLAGQRAVFRRSVKHMAGLKVPKVLVTSKLPEDAVHEADQFFAYLIKKYRLDK